MLAEVEGELYMLKYYYICTHNYGHVCVHIQVKHNMHAMSCANMKAINLNACIQLTGCHIGI